MKVKHLLMKTFLVAAGLLMGANSAWAVTGVDIWDFSSYSVWGNETSGGKSDNYKELATGSEVWFKADGSAATSATSNVSFKFVANGAKFNYGGVNKLGISSTGNYDSANDINYVKVVIPDGYRVVVDMSVGTSARPMHIKKGESVTDYTASTRYVYDNTTGSEETILIYATNGAANDYKNHHINSITLVNTATAPKNGWTANAVATINGTPTTIKTYSSAADVMQTDQYTVNVDKAILYNGSYYQLNDAAFSANTYGVTYIMGATAGNHNFTYEKIENCVFYGEAENICTAQSHGYTSSDVSVLSNGGGKYAMHKDGGYVTLTFNVAKAGFYDIKLGMNNTDSKGRGFNYQIDGGTESATINVAAYTPAVQEINDIYLTAGNHTLQLNMTYSLTPVFDYLLVTSDYTFSEVVGKTDKSSASGTKSSNYTIKKGETKVFTFRNYGSGVNGSDEYKSWHNWTIAVNDGVSDKISARADFYDNTKGSHTDGVWNVMSTDGGSTKTELNWDNFKDDMAAATVVATLSYAADGTLSLHATSTGDANGYIYYVDHSVSGVTADELTINLYVEYAWLGVMSVENTHVGATIGSTGWTTFASPYALDLSSMTASTGEVTAYYASAVGGGSVTMTSTESSAVVAGEGIMLKGTAGATITIPVVANGSAISGNKLVGCPTATELTTPNANYYVLVSNEGTAEFQNLSGSYTDNKVTIPAGKAYLDASESSAKSLTIVFDNETLGISDAKLLNGNTEGIGEKAIYNLSGQRIAAPQKGINIIGGRKVVVK